MKTVKDTQSIRNIEIKEKGTMAQEAGDLITLVSTTPTARVMAYRAGSSLILKTITTSS